jgi:hypothetical protein
MGVMQMMLSHKNKIEAARRSCRRLIEAVEMIVVRNSYWLSENLPNAVLMTYPDSGHGSLFIPRVIHEASGGISGFGLAASTLLNG